MVTTIVINCEDEREMFLHLTKIREQVKKHFKKNDDQITGRIEFKDSNCYGDHVAIIDLDK